MTWLACASGCALDSKSLGEDAGEDSGEDAGDDIGEDASEDASDDTGDDTGDDAGEGGKDTDGGPPQDAVELQSQLVEGVTPIEIAIAPDGSTYVVGASGYEWDPDSLNGRYTSAWLGKLAADGTIAWSVEPGEDAEAFVCAAASNDEIVVATAGPEFGGPTLLRYDVEGELVSSIAMPDGSSVDRMAIAPDGTIAIAGVGYWGADSSNTRTAAYDGATGELVWSTDVGTGDVESSRAQTLAFAPDGGVVVGGYQGVEYLTGRTRAWLASIDPSGTPRWVQTYTAGENSDAVEDVHVTSDGTIHAVVVEDRESSIRRFDADGAEIFVWDPALTPELLDITVADDGSFVATDGRAGESGEPPLALRVAGHDADGHARWLDERDDCTLGVDVVFLSGGDVLVAGACPPGEGDVQVAMGLFVYAP